MKKAIYAGSFDPITNGHTAIIIQASQSCEHLVLAIGSNPNKKYMFTSEERLEILKKLFGKNKRISYGDVRDGFLVHYAQRIGATHIIRGIRNVTDYEYERQMVSVNLDIDGRIRTVFFMADDDLSKVSSSLIKGLIGPAGWEKIVGNYVHPFVLKKLKEKFNASR